MVNITGLESIIEKGKAERAAAEAAALQRAESNFAKSYRDIQISVAEVLAADANVILDNGSRFLSKSQTVYMRFNDFLIADGRGWGDGTAFRISTVSDTDDYGGSWHTVKNVGDLAKAIEAIQEREAQEAARAEREAERQAQQLAKSPFSHLVPELQQLLWDVQHAHDLTDAQRLVCSVISVFATYANTDMPEWDAEDDEDDDA